MFQKGSNGAGAPALRQPLPVASASKWVSAAVILSLVADGTLSLDDHPQRYIPAWGNLSDASPPPDDDPRRRVKLRQLLSFTSGVEGAASTCDEAEVPPGARYSACAGRIYADLAGQAFEPGAEFAYSWRHLLVAAAMAEEATGSAFSELLEARVARPVGMEDGPAYAPGPWGPAGGLEISPGDYAKFLGALLRGDSGMKGVVEAGMFWDWTADVRGFNNSVFEVYERVGIYDKVQRWHYSLGHWIECYQGDGRTRPPRALD